MEFLVVDFENANSNGSICQIGIIKYSNGEITILMDKLVNPDEDFNPIVSRKIGLKTEDVKDTPLFPEFYEEIKLLIEGKNIFNQNGSDRSKLLGACERYELPIIESTWINSTTAAKRTWKGLDSYGLKALCREFDIEYVNEHNATADAIATAKTIEKATEEKGYSIEEWIKVCKPKR